jgi:hypothetical protein
LVELNPFDGRKRENSTTGLNIPLKYSKSKSGMTDILIIFERHRMFSKY